MSDDRPMPKPIRWLAIGFNVMLLFTEAVLFIQRGGLVIWPPEELAMVSLIIATPIFNLAMWLDYNRRGL